jgi:hypothetical protein
VGRDQGAAAKYGGGATAIHITTSAETVHVHVEDNGPGVPAEFRHRLFECLDHADRDVLGPAHEFPQEVRARRDKRSPTAIRTSGFA